MLIAAISRSLIVLMAGGALLGCHNDVGCDGQSSPSQPVEFGIYDWERTVIPRSGTKSPKSSGYPRPPKIDSNHPANSIVVEGESKSGASEFFVLRDEPSLTEADVADVVVDHEENEESEVTLELTPEGEHAFTKLIDRVTPEDLFTEPSGRIGLVLDREVAVLGLANYPGGPEATVTDEFRFRVDSDTACRFADRLGDGE